MEFERQNQYMIRNMFHTQNLLLCSLLTIYSPQNTKKFILFDVIHTVQYKKLILLLLSISKIKYQNPSLKIKENYSKTSLKMVLNKIYIKQI